MMTGLPGREQIQVASRNDRPLSWPFGFRETTRVKPGGLFDAAPDFSSEQF